MWRTGRSARRWSGCVQFRWTDRLLMENQVLPDDFKEFLKLLNEANVQYLLIGGYAVGYHGYPRATADMDIWVAISPDNAKKLVDVFRRFGMQDPKLTEALFLESGKIVRMGVPPMRIEVLTDIDGVSFDECFQARISVDIDGQDVSLIARKHLRQNKRASARHKDLDDLENLPAEDQANQALENDSE